MTSKAEVIKRREMMTRIFLVVLTMYVMSENVMSSDDFLAYLDTMGQSIWFNV